MRLYEISSITQNQLTPRVDPKTDPNDAISAFDTEDMEEIGSGMYAAAFSKPEEPGTVRKIAGPVQDLKYDAYFQYVKLMTKSDRMTSNPYFPKIFDVQVRQFYRKDFTGKKNLGKEYAYAVDMERLLPFDRLSQEESFALGDKMFFDFERRTKANRYGSGQKSEPKNYHEALEGMIEATMEHWTAEQMTTAVKDPKFKQAVMLLKKLERTDNRVAFDIHSENIMVRRGPGGPQIVITDPVQTN